MFGPLTLEIISIVFLGFRFYSRWITLRRFETDDFVMLVAGVWTLSVSDLGARTYVISGPLCSICSDRTYM